MHFYKKSTCHPAQIRNRFCQNQDNTGAGKPNRYQRIKQYRQENQGSNNEKTPTD
jgi:hypothetical protein